MGQCTTVPWLYVIFCAEAPGIQVRTIPEDRTKVMRRMGGPRFKVGRNSSLTAFADQPL